MNTPMDWSTHRITLAHDWLLGMRGGERVLETLCAGMPAAPIHTLFYRPDAISPAIQRHAVHPSVLNWLPAVHRYYRLLLPLFPAVIDRTRVAPADLLISTSHCVVKGLRPPPGARHLCYCFTPMRYAWTFYDEYFGRNPAKALLTRPLLAHLRRWDKATAAHVTRFVAISKHIQTRIRTFYGRESDVVYPPVDTDRCVPAGSPHANFDLIVSALVPYKRVDLAVRTYTASGYPLVVVGTGTEMPRLRALAGSNVRFLGWQSDAEVLALYQHCRLLVFPGEEDFGIVPLEAQACGRPVVAYGRGGALETVLPEETGVFFNTQEPAALHAAVTLAAALRWDAARIRAHAVTFGIPAFLAGMDQAIGRCLDLPQP